jgi:hypothetical protein
MEILRLRHGTWALELFGKTCLETLFGKVFCVFDGVLLCGDKQCPSTHFFIAAIAL